MGKFSNLFGDKTASLPVSASSSTGKFSGLFSRPQEKPPSPKQPNAVIKHLAELPSQIAKTPGVPLLKKAFSPETMKRGLDVSGVGDIPAITQDISSIPSRLAGFPTIPLQSKLATEAIPKMAEEVFEPRGEFQVPTITPKNIPRLFTGKPLLKNPVRPSIADVAILGSFARSGIQNIGQRLQFNRGLAKELAKPIIEAEILQARRRAGVEPWPAGKAPIETTASTVSPEPKTQGLKLLPDTTTKPKPSIQPVAGGKSFTGKLALKPGEDISGVSVVQTTSPAQIKDVSGRKLNFGANDSIFTYPIVSQSTGKFTGKVMVKDGDKGIVSLPKDLTPEEAKLKIEERITGSKPKVELPEEAQVAVRLYKGGASQLDIARKFNITQSAVSYQLKKAGIKMRPFEPPKVSDETRTNIVELYKQGSRYRDIMKQLNVSSNTIKNSLENAGVVFRHLHKDTINENLKKEAIRLYSDEEMSTQEIADRLQISAPTIVRTIAKAGITRTPSERISLKIEQGSSMGKGGIRTVWHSAKTEEWNIADSSYELVRMKQLDNDPTVKYWTKKVSRVPIGEKSFYVPDIYIEYIDGRKVIEEIKPSYKLQDENVLIKKDAAEKYFNKEGMIYRLVTEYDITKEGFEKFNPEDYTAFTKEEQKRLKEAISGTINKIKSQPALMLTPAIKAKIAGQPIGGGLPLEKRQAAMQERIMNVDMAKDRIAEINNVRKQFLHRIRKYKKGYLKEELAGFPPKYITVSGGISPDEALQDLRDNYGVDLPNESVLKDYFIGLDKEINELKDIIATNKPKIVARSEATILKREQKLTEGLQKKFSGQAKKIIQEAAKTSTRLERKAFKAGKATEAERRKKAYFGPQRSKEERSKLYLLAKEKGLYYTDFKGKPHDKLAGILKYYPEASFDQLREYISSLTGDPQNPPKLFKLHGDITKDTEVIKLLNQVSGNWQDINTLEIHSLDPARIVEKVTQQDLWDDNILADNTFSVYAAADEAKYDRLTRENADLIANKMGIKRGSKESSELMRKFEAGEPLTEKEKLVTTYLRRKYDAFIAEANEMRLRLGKKPIPYRRDYMTHILEQNLLSDFFKGDTDRMSDISSEQLDAIRKGDYTKGNMPFNRFALRRKGKKTKYDAIGNYEIYLKTILNEIYFTPAITHARKFIEYALVKQPNAYKALDRLANDLKGKPSIEDQNAIGRLASFRPIKILRSLQAKSALLGNINFWLMNSSNFAVSYDELGNYMNKGLAKFLGNKKWRDFAFKHSDMLKGRTIDPDIEPSSFKIVEEAAGYVTNLLEYNNVGSTFMGAYFKGIDLGYPQAKSIKYADSIARRTQVGYKKFELNAWMRSNSGMLLSQFQSWTFNAMNHILYDLGVANLPRNLLGKFTGQKPRPIKYGKLLTLVAIGMLLNLLYKKSGLREPYTPESAMPRIPGLGGSVPPVVRIGQNIGTAFTGKKPETRQKAAIRAGLSFIPGGTQLGRIFTGKLLPVKKDTEIKTISQPKISSKFGGSKFKARFKFKKRF